MKKEEEKILKAKVKKIINLALQKNIQFWTNFSGHVNQLSFWSVKDWNYGNIVREISKEFYLKSEYETYHENNQIADEIINYLKSL